MKFGTSIQCMDGRIQEPILKYIKENYDIEFIDTITEAGPNLYLSVHDNVDVIKSIYQRIDISKNKHGSKLIFISGHYDCAGNPVKKEIQLKHINESAEFLGTSYPDMQIVKLWVNKNWKVEKI
ncbi:MAG: hypothetical protein JEY94_09435 [Melioribacteraceae bacterium]|nr:hypothetical protein [Melioribacteraceae bacterium]